jgi:hypothetical protein
MGARQTYKEEFNELFARKQDLVGGEMNEKKGDAIQPAVYNPIFYMHFVYE